MNWNTYERRRSVLLVMPDLPFPARRNGLSVRYHPLLRMLGRTLDIHLVCFSPTEGEKHELPEDLRSCVRTFSVVSGSGTRPSIMQRIGVQFRRALPIGIPHVLYSYEAKEIAHRLDAWLSEDFDAVLWVSCGHTLQHAIPRIKGKPLYVDAVDSISLYFSREESRIPMLTRIRTWKMRRWECSVLRAAARCFYVSPIDAAMVRPYMGEVPVEVLPNGLLLDDMRDGRVEIPSPCIGFLGNMTYKPNVDAAKRLLSIFSNLKRTFPNLVLYIIGRESSPAALGVDVEENVIYSGTVDNIWPHIRAVDVFAFPMYRGSGMQNKLLEVMAAGKAVVTTSVASNGLQAPAGQALLTADNEDDFVAALTGLLQNEGARNAIGQAGQAFVQQSYDLKRIATRLEQVLTSGKR